MLAKGLLLGGKTMHSLFSKIFIWFWLAMIFNIALAITIFLTITIDEKPPHENQFLKALTIYGERAIELYASEGEQSVKAYVQYLRRKTQIDMHVVSVKEAKSLAPEARQLLELADGEDWAAVKLSEGRHWTAKRFQAKDGSVYCVIFKLHHGPRPPLDRMFLVYLFACLVTASCFCYWLARYFSTPIRYLRSMTQKLANGDLKVRVAHHWQKRHDEISELAHDFDVMADHIDNLLSGQHRLLRDISHELRSPLARLKVALELARQHAEPKAEAFLQRIECEANRLNDMIGQLLLIAKYSCEEQVVPKAPIVLNQLIKQIVEDANFEAHTRNCTVNYVAQATPTVYGVKELLASAIENVLRNAIHYTADGTEVLVLLTVEQRSSQTYARVYIQDHGPGVPKTAEKLLFQPFYRVDEARDRKTGGTGLGLAISDRAVRMHGGTITAYNAPQGGLAVEILLPVAAANTLEAD